jgi:hypothetical protein
MEKLKFLKYKIKILRYGTNICNVLPAPGGPQGCEMLRLSHFYRHLVNRCLWGCQPYVPATLYPQEYSWYSFLSGWFSPRAIVQLKGLGKLKNPVTSEIEPMYLNQLHYCLPDIRFIQRLKMWLFMRYGELAVIFLKPWLKLCYVRNSAYVVHCFDFIILRGDWTLVFCFLYKHVTFKPLLTFPNKVTF